MTKNNLKVVKSTKNQELEKKELQLVKIKV